MLRDYRWHLLVLSQQNDLLAWVTQHGLGSLQGLMGHQHLLLQPVGLLHQVWRHLWVAGDQWDHLTEPQK